MHILKRVKPLIVNQSVWLCTTILLVITLIFNFAVFFPSVAISSSPTQPVIQIKDEFNSYDLSKYLFFLEDKDNNLTIDQVSGAEFSQQFRQPESNPPSFGYTSSTYWGRLELQNTTTQPIQLILSLEYLQIDRIAIYLPNWSASDKSQTETAKDLNRSEPWLVKHTGLLYPFASRDVNDRLPAFRINLPPQVREVVYLRFQTTTPLIIQAYLGDTITFWQYRSLHNIWLGLFYGILIFAILYNLLLYTALKDHAYLYYIGFAIGVGIIMASLDGFGTQYFWPSAIWWNKYAVPVITYPTSIALLRWITLFLETKRFLPRWHQGLKLHQLYLTFVFISWFIWPFRFVSLINTLGMIATCSLAITLGVITFRRGYLPARYYLLSSTLFLGSIVVHQLSQLKLIPAFVWLKDGYRFGIIASVVLLSLALADRINLLKAEKLQEQKLALQEKEQLNESLQESQIQLIEREQQLEYEVLHDALTGIPNRNWLSEHLENVIQSREDFAILFIDLDRFKIINDSLGHLVGDEILKQATKRIRAVLPEFASLSRFGGDEFVVLVEEAIDLNTLTNLSDLIQLQLQLPFYLNNYELFISASIGITISHEEEYTHPEEVLRDADLAMYKAKHQGRGRYATFTHGDRVAAMSRLHMERDLRQALEQEEFYLHYQPIVSLETLHIIGFEALVRWHHPSGQPISPTQFITVAEETGLINSLGWWIMREACQQIHQWNQQLGVGNWLSVNVNVSPVQLRQVDFLARVKQILHETGLPYDLLKLEITESCLLDNIDGTNELFAQFKELGIKLCIDDFGTGYSSLSRLHELPIDTLKIDQSFVKRIGSAADSVAMIQTISSLADSLQISSVAEGIETQSQLDELIAIGCHLGQGYLFAKSCSAEDAWELLQKLAPKHGSSQMLPSVSR